MLKNQEDTQSLSLKPYFRALLFYLVQTQRKKILMKSFNFKRIWPELESTNEFENTI